MRKWRTRRARGEENGREEDDEAWAPRVSGTEAGAARAEADARSWAASGPRARKGGWAEGIRPEAEIEILNTFSILENTGNSNKQKKIAIELRKILEKSRK